LGMSKHQRVVLAILVSLTCIISQTLDANAARSARQSARTGSRLNVTGDVVRVDVQSRTMTLRSGGATISLNISNPVLQGYSSIGAIRKGDRVGAGYTADGIFIAKLPRSAGKEEATVVETAPAPKGKKSKKSLPFARRSSADARSFASADNNKDGKISAIELCVVIPDLTMDQFRQYDKNHDGYLDKTEFEQIKLP
jgi:hypothetical protein